MRRYRLNAIHARNHVPAAMALMVRRLRGMAASSSTFAA